MFCDNGIIAWDTILRIFNIMKTFLFLIRLQRSRFEGEVGSNADRRDGARGDLVDRGALDCSPAWSELSLGSCIFSAVRDCDARRPRPGGIDMPRPAFLWRAAAAATSGSDEQLLETGAKLFAEETVYEGVDAAVGRACPLCHRYYHLYSQ